MAESIVVSCIALALLFHLNLTSPLNQSSLGGVGVFIQVIQAYCQLWRHSSIFIEEFEGLAKLEGSYQRIMQSLHKLLPKHIKGIANPDQKTSSTINYVSKPSSAFMLKLKSLSRSTPRSSSNTQNQTWSLDMPEGISIEGGCVTHLTGANNSGKSTLLRALSQLKTINESIYHGQATLTQDLMIVGLCQKYSLLPVNHDIPVNLKNQINNPNPLKLLMFKTMIKNPEKLSSIDQIVLKHQDKLYSWILDFLRSMLQSKDYQEIQGQHAKLENLSGGTQSKIMLAIINSALQLPKLSVGETQPIKVLALLDEPLADLDEASRNQCFATLGETIKQSNDRSAILAPSHLEGFTDKFNCPVRTVALQSQVSRTEDAKASKLSY